MPEPYSSDVHPSFVTPFGTNEKVRPCHGMTGTSASMRSLTAAAFSWMPPA